LSNIYASMELHRISHRSRIKDARAARWSHYAPR
jgi:hypothetical protein